MSRETDSSSSGPQGRGGAAYPSGTPPYGSRQYPSLHPQDAPDETGGAAPEQQPEEKKTETTLTTRIRINIPGSRPIPPVVMRTPMSDVSAGPDADAAKASGSGAGSGSGSRSASAAASAASAAPERESERTGSTSRPGAARETAGTSAPAAEEKSATSDWFAPRKPAAGTTAGQGKGTGAGTGAGAPAGSVPGPGGPGTPKGPGGPGPAAPSSGLAALAEQAGSPAKPSGPTGRGPGATGPGGPGNGFAPPGPGMPPPGARPPGAPDRNGGPAGPTAGPATGSMPLGPRTGTPAPGIGAPTPRMSDDTAVLTPQKPAPEGGAGHGHVSGDTLTSGMPVVPGAHRSPFPPLGGPQTGPGTGPNPILAQRPAPPRADHGDFSVPEFPAGPGGDAPASPGDADRPAPRPTPAPAPAKRGRSKLVLAAAAVVGLLGIAYGAGLLLNHSDVPKSTTVLGIDIGGGTKDEAVNKLEAAFGERAKAPLQLSVGGEKAELHPDKAGLSLDSQATVRGAAGSDYNPVSVIGSLFGGERVAEPVIVVDEEKLSVALADLAGTAGSSTDGTIRFEPDKAVAVPGKPGRSLDVGRSMISVKDAYRTQVQTGEPNVVELPMTTREPTITQAEIDRAMKEFAEPAMSDLITIKAGDKSIQFGPAKSLPKILSMKAIDGRLVEVYDKKAIDTLLEGVFDGVMITKGDGKQHEVTADDVAQAMGPALRGKTPAERTAVIELNPN
ncbi:hypothetical protein [Streptomyces xantholiticus]|uniref:Peptidoglycan binding domain-containing protein n=1 Tax=Streptomyces xantholiticus TaxID=68285 RepID=A0ABV1USM4_9ACTN